MQLPEETGATLYSVFGYLRWPVYLGMLLLYSRRFATSKKQVILLCILFLVAHEWGNYFPPLMYRITDGYFPGNNMGVGFLFFLLIVAAAAYMLRIPVLRSLDALSPVFILGRGIGILGCVFTGCCYGFHCNWGIYSPRAGTMVFPTVMLDATVSYGIAACLIILARRCRYNGNGSVFAASLLLFGILRTVIDILRDNWKQFNFLSIEGLFGLIYILVGAITLFLIIQKAKQANEAAARCSMLTP